MLLKDSIGENPAENGKKRTLKRKEHKEEAVMDGDSELTAPRSCLRKQQGQETEVQTSPLLQVQDVTVKGSRAEANMRSSARREGKCSSNLQHHRVPSEEGERKRVPPSRGQFCACLSISNTSTSAEQQRNQLKPHKMGLKFQVWHRELVRMRKLLPQAQGKPFSAERLWQGH